MRHTFASFAIASGVSLFYLARLMGTSVEQIDRTYGHMLPDSEEYLRGLLDGFDASLSQADDSSRGVFVRQEQRCDAMNVSQPSSSSSQSTSAIASRMARSSKSTGANPALRS
jgi:hypothetical protein